MIRARGGVIVDIASIYGLMAAPNRAAYCATKAAVAMDLVEQRKIGLESPKKRAPQGRLATPEQNRSPRCPFSLLPTSPLILLGKLLEWTADGRPMVISNTDDLALGYL